METSTKQAPAPQSLIDAADGVLAQMEEYKCWDSHNFVVPVATSLKDCSPMDFDVGASLGQFKKQGKRQKQLTKRIYFLPEFNQNTDEFRKDVILPFLAEAALDAEFSIRIKVNKGEEMKFECSCGRFFNHRKSKNHQEEEASNEEINKDTKNYTAPPSNP
jgi:hypothetical protein